MPISCVLVGASGTGKTGLFQSLTNGSSRHQAATCACHVKPIPNSGGALLWDTPGAERLHAVMKSAIRQAGVVLIVTEAKQFRIDEIERWVTIAHTYSTASPGIIVVLTKASARDNMPHCAYKTVMINTQTGLNVEDFKTYLADLCARLHPMQTNQSPRHCSCWSFIVDMFE